MMRKIGITKILLMVFAILAAAIPTVAATSLEEEVELGRKLDVEILKEYPQVTDDAALKEINEYGQELMKGESIRRPEIKYHFRILKQDEFNAFSTPGGYVYFSSRLWYILRPDERKGVIAHEIVHSDRRHALDAMSKAQRRSLWLGAILTVLGASQTVGDVTGILHNLYTLKYSRGDERQADEIGTQLLLEAGYNPVGVLLSMRKINRFQEESGGETPKIFSSHPPTPERLEYLTALLNKMDISIPPEDIKDIPNPNKIGGVTKIAGNSVEFTSSEKLQAGDIVWLMGQGWDFRYENHIDVPVARGIVTKTSGGYFARITPISDAKSDQIGLGTGVYVLPAPEPVSNVAARVESAGKIVSKSSLTKFDRFLAVQQVWEDEDDKVVNDNIGYAIITNPQSATGYLAVNRPRYKYAPVAAGSALVKLSDPDKERWVGPIISVGRGGQTIEVLPSRSLDPKKTYEVAYPAWSLKDKYEKRIIGSAKLSSTKDKIVMKMLSYRPGYSMADIQTGFDVYEELPPKSDDKK
ncbi:MAG: M48 family metalloprotease [Armatimonadota bacterium]|nr:M48 family metalloprotease [bacterium]